MIASLRQLFRAREATAVQPSAMVPPGRRIYAVGDIHGRADLFAALGLAIDRDDRSRDPADSCVVLLGDLIDRGPDSAGVLALAQAWQQTRKVHILAGNHEDMLLASLTDVDTLRAWLRYGGAETVLSFGIAPQTLNQVDFAELQALMQQRIPPATLDFLRSFEDQLRIGDYLFVHAGVRPGVPLDQQSRADLLWIREPFLGHDGDLAAVVVHGHTISETPVFRANRIGIDTGAFASGVLTALGLEADRRWLVEACETPDGIQTRVCNIVSGEFS